MCDFQKEKYLVKSYQKDFDTTKSKDLTKILRSYTSDNYHWRGMHPFYEQNTVDDVISTFWNPLRRSFTALQRREDIFFAGSNDCDGGKTNWVISAGFFLGLFDKDWIGIRSTGKAVMIRYAEFHRIEKNKIIETVLFIDILDIMNQAGQYPLPPMTATSSIYAGPRNHDGLLYEKQPKKEGEVTITLVNKMIADLSTLNESGSYTCSPELLAESWHKDMVWYGPAGIGITYTIPRYQEQHQLPFRENLTDKVFNGHVARFSEGNYCSFFGWPNLNNRNMGGFLGMTSTDKHAPMRVVDIYRRKGDKLAENWVYIDMLYYLHEQGLDVLERMKKINRTI